ATAARRHAWSVRADTADAVGWSHGRLAVGWSFGDEYVAEAAINDLRVSGRSSSEAIATG
ncbi:MAG: hypothetical protein M3N52_09530, partial [Actinomycetota bacterium]|nr:hypothetical protein [Actinomycetota bacterium]